MSSSGGAALQNVLVRFYVIAGNGKINTNQNLVEILTNASGVASVNFNLGTIGGTNTVRALIVGNPTEIVNFSHTTVVNAAAAVDLSTTSVSVTPASLVANGIAQTAVKLTVRDQYGNQIPRTTGTVVFTASAGTLLGSVTNNLDGTWTQQLRAPTSRGSGTLTVSATFDGSALTSTAASVSLMSGQVDLTQSTISLSPSSITADGSSSSIVTVTLRDANGNQISTGGETVAIAASAGTLLGTGVTDNGDGTYQRAVRSNTIAQTSTISATVGGNALSSTASLAFAPGAVVLAKSSILVSPSTLFPNGSSTTTVTVTLRDANNNQLSTGGSTVAVSSTAGSWSTAVIDNNNGTYQRVLKAGVVDATAVVSATVNGSALPSSVNVYITSGASGPNTLKSTVEIVGGTTTLAANGTTTATVRVTLKDSTNTQMAVGGSTVTLATSAGTLIGSVLDNGNGTYTQTIRAPSLSSIATISASFDGQAISNTASVQYYGSLSLSQSTMAAYPSAVVADNTSTTLLVITAKDSSGITIPVGGETGITFATTAGTLQGSIADNGNGTYSQSLKAPASAANATVTASKSGNAFSAGTTVTFFASNNLAGVAITCANIATYKNTNIMVTSGTLTMTSYTYNYTTSTLTDCSSDFVFGSIVLNNSGVITHGATTSTIEYGLEFTASSLSIDATSKIDVTGKGYPGQPTGGSQRTQANSISASFLTYGSIFYPYDLGASGKGWDSGAYQGATGGGKLKITISNGGMLQNNGSILANGNASGATYGQAGWGGSIWITTGTLSGAGAISANGGAITAARVNRYDDGGMGGRVAIYYTTAQNNFAGPTSVVSNVTACGGAHTSVGYEGGAGTVYLKGASQTYGDLIINNCNRSSINLGLRTVINAPPTAVPDALTSTTLTKANTFGDVFSTSKNPYVGWCANPNITQNGTIALADDTCFPITSGTKDSVSISAGSLLSVGDASKTYQVMLKFDNVEITGKASLVSIAPIVSTSGDLQSGNTTTASVAGCPSGGVEYPGQSSITLDPTGSYCPSTIVLTNSNFGSAVVTLKSATYTLSNTTAGSLTFDGATVTANCTRLSTCFSVTNTFSLINTSYLYQGATSASVEYSLEITAGSLNVSSNSQINANGRGYTYAGTAALTGVTFPNAQYTSGVTSGGSYGGKGGSASAAGPAIYGSYVNPYMSGTTGTYDGGASGNGGGIVRINLNGGPAVIDGIIDVGGGAGRNGGSGGSVYLNAGAVSGSGTLRANGGNGSAYGGGGGGRIALNYISTSGNFAYPTSILARLQAYGGNYVAVAQGFGAAGTIYLKGSTQTYGDLYVNNNNQVTASTNISTFMNIPAASTSTALTSTSLTDTGKFVELTSYNTGHLVGMCLNPNTAQNATATYTDDSCFIITSQTANAVNSTGINTGTTGSPYQVMLVLDNLEVAGKSVFASSGPVLVNGGDISGNATNTMSVVGTLLPVGSVNIETPNLTSFVYNAGGATINLGSVSTPAALTLAGGTFTTNAITAGALTLDAATVTPTCLKGTSCITLTDALTLQNNAILYQLPTTLSAEYALEISAGSLNVGLGSTISVAGRGYTSTGRTAADGYSSTFPNASFYLGTYFGGSHGGKGGCNSGSGPSTYGSFADPNTSGGSGAYYTGYAGAAGGGIVRINLGSGSATVDGVIDANGTYAYRTGGAGGSILLRAGTITGSGTLRANGAYGEQAGGGGGRVAVYYTTASGGFSYPTSILSRLQAFGGTYANSNGYGAAGTIFLKSAAQTYGDMIINNNGQVTYGSYINTPINIATGASAALSSSALTHGGMFKENGANSRHLVGMCLNPNTAQNSTATYNDDTCFMITEQTIDNLYASNISVGSAGNAYTTMLVLANLQIAGKAIFAPQGPVLVKNGDISSGTTDTVTSFVGVSYGAPIEFVGLASATFDGGGLSTASYFNPVTTTGNLTFQNGLFNMVCLKDSPCVTAGGALTLLSSATLGHQYTTTTTEYALEINAASLNVSADSVISAAGRGYTSTGVTAADGYSSTFPNASFYLGTYYGGSHGGKGGCSSGSGPSTYGSFADPNTSGGSGAYFSGYGGAAGGGIVRINLGSGTATLDGIIDANGTYAFRTGGAGGSILLRAGTVTGSGTLRANGVYGEQAGGGGGRVAVYYTTASGGFSYPTSILSRLQAFGGTYANSNGYGAAGTIFLKSAAQTYGDMIINNNGQVTYGSYINTPINIATGASTALSSSALTHSGMFKENGANSRHLVGTCLNPNTAQNSTTTYADDTCYPITDQTVNTLSASNISIGSSGNTYTTMLVLDNLEIAGKAIFAPQGRVLVKKGDISSNTTDTVTSFVGASYGTPIEYAGLTSALFDGGALSTPSYFNPITTTGALTFQNGTFYATCLKDSSCITAGGALTVKSTATIAQQYTTTTAEYALEINAASLTVETGGGITAAGRGYVGHASTFYSYSFPNTAYYYGSYYGGSHGGRGGNDWGPIGPYGSFADPNTSGASGGNGTGGAGGSGGGIVRINLGAGTATIDGTINANGNSGSGSHIGGGAGGSILLRAGTIAGSGTISTNGGTGVWYQAGGGGGGRIAVYYTTATGGFAYPSSMLSRVQAFGGGCSSCSYGFGAAGTIFLKSAAQTYGDMYINNNNQSTSATTPIKSVTGVSASLSTSALTQSGAFLEVGANTKHLVGMCLNPNTAQNSTATYTDDTCFVITNQTANDLSASNINIGSAGNTYTTMLVLDNLEVSGKAVFAPQGPVLVKNGDISSNTTNTASVVGSLAASNNVEYEGLVSATLDGGSGTTTLSTLATTGALTLQNGTFVMNCTKTASSCVSVGGALTVKGTATLQQQATTTTAEYALNINAASLTVENGGSISAAGRGYVGHASTYYSYSFPNTAYYYGSYYGGSHGGRGGNDWGPIGPYGSFADPNTSGASGGNGTGGAGGSGGGIVRINLGAGTATIDGTINANGNSGSGSHIGGGAGGSILLRAGTIAGSGTISTNGGTGVWYQAGGGGGGRIAVYYTTATGGFAYPSSILSRVQAFGGGCSSCSYGFGAAGTIFLKSAAQTYGDMYINNNNQSTSSTTVINIPAARASGGLTANTLTDNGRFVENTANSRHLVGLCLNPNTAQNSTLTYTDDTCYVITDQTSDTLTASNIAVGTAGNTYQAMLVLDNLQVSGKGILTPTGPMLVKSGDISSDTTNTFAMSGVVGGGSGYAEFQGLASGTLDGGSLSAIAASYFNNLTTTGSVVMQNGAFVANSASVGVNLTLNAATYYAGSAGLTTNLAVTGDIALTNTSSFTSLSTTATAEYRLNVTAANLSVDSTSNINVTGRGYQCQNVNFIRGPGNINYSTGANNTGGSYGGQGGVWSGSTNAAYGKFNAPTDLGSSGSDGYSQGGGAVRITTSGTLTLNGPIMANAATPSTNVPAGTGGSIFVTTNTLAGSSYMSANGVTANYASGSGGRIAVYYGSSSGAFSGPTVYNAIYALGAGGSRPSAPGTVYLKKNSQTYGDLIINNGGTTGAGWTSLTSPSVATSGTLTSTTLSAGGAFTNSYGLTDQLVGMYVNPNTGQNATNKLSDDTVFPILSSDAGSLTISTGDMTGVASSGNAFKLQLVLDNLEVRGGGNLDFGTQRIYVLSGDLTSNNSTSFVQGGSINAGVMDVGPSTSWTFTTGTITTKCSSNYSCP
ncbi:MAG: Ig-like domain-containing protein [Pseudomonadota bacterium]